MSATGTFVPLSRAQAKATARRMFLDSDGAWNITQIQRYLERRGVKVSWSTVRRWADPQWEEIERKRAREAQRARWRRLHGVKPHAYRSIDPAAKLQRLFELRRVGLSAEDAARVLRLDFGDEITRFQVMNAEKTGRYPTQRPRGPRRKAVAS